MKPGTGCRIGAVAVAKVHIVATAAGPALDAHYHLIDPKDGSVVGVSRKTRDWPPEVQATLSAFLDSVETAIARRVFEASEGSVSLSIAEHLREFEARQEQEEEEGRRT